MAEKTTTNLDIALEYVKRGWPVFPTHYVLKDGSCSCRIKDCNRIGKHPATKNGVKDASTDPAQITRWWKAGPYYNIGLATGHNGLVVLDVDIGKEKKGPQSLAKLEEANGELPETLRATTGSGGTHYYFCSLETIKNSAGKIGAGLDIRGIHGYVILPPSNHTKGRYSWQNEDTKIADMPEWLAKLAASHQVDPTKDKAQEFERKDLIHLDAEDVKKVLKAIPADDRDTWWKIGAALKTEYGDKGLMIWNEWSASSPKYQENIQEVQWASFKPGEITMGTILHYAKENGWQGFDAETANDPIIKANWLFIVGIKRFLEVNRMIELDREQFDCQFFPLFKKGRPSDHVLKNETFPRVDNATYWPEQPSIVIEEGLKKANMWRPSGVTPASGDVSPFLNHVIYLFPDPYEQSIMLDYMAFQVQHPGEKVHWAVVIKGVQGNGKSYLGHVMKLVLGLHNVSNIQSEILHESFTGWQRNTQLVIVEEMMARARLELMNKLKPMITEPWCMIREMYKPPYRQPCRFNFLFLTNHPDALIIDNTDRRYCILDSGSPPHVDGVLGYYKPLWDWTDQNAPALLHYLHSRDLVKFQPKAHAPMTKGKQALIQESLPPLDSWIVGQVDAVEWPFNVDLMAASDLALELPKFGLKANPKEIGRAFMRLGFLNLGKQRIGDKGEELQGRIWAVRHYDTYSQLEGQQIRILWLQQGDNAPRESGDNPKDEDIINRHRRNRPPNMVSETKPM